MIGKIRLILVKVLSFVVMGYPLIFLVSVLLFAGLFDSPDKFIVPSLSPCIM